VDAKFSPDPQKIVVGFREERNEQIEDYKCCLFIVVVELTCVTRWKEQGVTYLLGLRSDVNRSVEVAAAAATVCFVRTCTSYRPLTGISQVREFDVKVVETAVSLTIKMYHVVCLSICDVGVFLLLSFPVDYRLGILCIVYFCCLHVSLLHVGGLFQFHRSDYTGVAIQVLIH